MPAILSPFPPTRLPRDPGHVALQDLCGQLGGTMQVGAAGCTGVPALHAGLCWRTGYVFCDGQLVVDHGSHYCRQ